METEQWLQRSFDFALPASRFPSLLERLRGTPARLDERTRDVAAERLTRAHPGRWSAQENIGHLLDLERLWLRLATQYVAAEREPCAGGSHESGHDRFNETMNTIRMTKPSNTRSMGRTFPINVSCNDRISIVHCVCGG